MMRKLFAGAVLAVLATPVLAEPEACKAVRMADLGWTDIGLTNTTAETLLDAMGYDASQTVLGLTVAYTAMQRGDIDVFQGNWRPFQDVEYKTFFDDGSVERLGMNLDGAKYTLAVPKYVSDAGVVSFDDLAAHADQFDKKIYAIEPGSNQPLLDMVAANAHGLGDWTIVESSESGMLAQVGRATARNEWIVFLGWQPHPMNLTYQMSYLSGGDAEFGPNYGGATVHTIARKGYAKDCPNAAKFFTQLVFNIDYENEGMQMVMGDGMELPDASNALMLKHPEMLDLWLKDITTFDGQPALPAVKAALGL
jgi:glycine betaine/proline transport system substrate-binding protein